jgi:hypothetical protein
MRAHPFITLGVTKDITQGRRGTDRENWSYAGLGRDGLREEEVGAAAGKLDY